LLIVRVGEIRQARGDLTEVTPERDRDQNDDGGGQAAPHSPPSGCPEIGRFGYGGN
jgi:hypothetical protein